jgi:hypothetical protein
MLITLYARKEPTVDSVATSRGMKRFDAALYEDKDCTKPSARWPWFYSSCPRFGQRTVRMNCALYRLVWVKN